MKNNIVHTKNKDVFVDSKTISRMLDVPHKVLINTIERIKKNNGTTMPLKFPQKFMESSFTNKMGRTYKMYEINEQAYMKLAMHLSGYEKADIVQDQIIEAFSMMKSALLNKDNASWLEARNQTKLIRREETDVIKNFIEYATSQGSKNASKYYRNITKMTNKALELLIQVNDGVPLRDLASIHELGFIQVLDHCASLSLEYGMKENLPYKYIYQLAKKEVNKLADSLNFRKSISNS